MNEIAFLTGKAKEIACALQDDLLAIKKDIKYKRSGIRSDITGTYIRQIIEGFARTVYHL